MLDFSHSNRMNAPKISFFSFQMPILTINILIIFFLGFFFSQIFSDYYHFHHNKITKRSIDPAHHHQRRLDDDRRVRWSMQQQIRTRSKRDFIQIRQSRASLNGKNRWMMNDPKWSQMWYLVSHIPFYLNFRILFKICWIVEMRNIIITIIFSAWFWMTISRLCISISLLRIVNKVANEDKFQWESGRATKKTFSHVTNMLVVAASFALCVMGPY